MTTHGAQKTQQGHAGKALMVALRILDKWGADSEQVQNILQIPKSTLHKYKSDPESVALTDDRATRVSYVLNMHAALQTVFDNKANVYGFMKSPNDGPFFNGASPLSLIGNGDFGALYETFCRVDALRGPW